MKIIQKPSNKQLQRMMNLIALPATLDEEGIYDRFSCYGWAYFTKDYCKWLQEKYPELYNRAKTDSDITPIECQFWWRDDDEDSTGYEAFKKNAEYIYTHKDALEHVCEELKEFYDNFEEYKEETEMEDDRWEEDFIPFDSEKEYISELSKLFKDVEYASISPFKNKSSKGQKKQLFCQIQQIDRSNGNITVIALVVDSGFAGVQMDLDDESQLNGCKEGDYAYFDENSNTFTVANDDPNVQKVTKKMNTWNKAANDMLKKSSKNLYFLDSIHEDGNGGADLAILPANMTGDFEEDFKDVPFIHINDMSELNGVEEGDYFLYDEATNTITLANNHPTAKQIIDDSRRIRQELIDMSNGQKSSSNKNSNAVQTINSWVPEVQPGRKAKVMSKRDFIDMLIDDVYQYLCPEEQEWVNVYQDGGRPGPIIIQRDNRYEQYSQPKFYEAFIAGLNDPKNKRFALIRKDVSKLADQITSFSEAYHLKKGLGTVHNGSIWFVGIGLWTDINVDGEAGRGSATAFAYYDGKDWRAFVPTRGNTINAKTKHIILYSHHSNKYKATEGIVRQEDYEYLKSHNYNLDMTGEINDPDTDLMLASLETRLIEA